MSCIIVVQQNRNMITMPSVAPTEKPQALHPYSTLKMVIAEWSANENGFMIHAFSNLCVHKSAVETAK